jgi:hypothetical protein
MHTLVKVVHPNIASLHAFSTDGARRCLVLELCAGSLDARLEVGLCLNTQTAHYSTRVSTRGSPTARYNAISPGALAAATHTDWARGGRSRATTPAGWRAARCRGRRACGLPPGWRARCPTSTRGPRRCCTGRRQVPPRLKTKEEATTVVGVAPGYVVTTLLCGFSLQGREERQRAAGRRGQRQGT